MLGEVACLVDRVQVREHIRVIIHSLIHKVVLLPAHAVTDQEVRGRVEVRVLQHRDLFRVRIEQDVWPALRDLSPAVQVFAGEEVSAVVDTDSGPAALKPEPRPRRQVPGVGEPRDNARSACLVETLMRQFSQQDIHPVGVLTNERQVVEVLPANLREQIRPIPGVTELRARASIRAHVEVGAVRQFDHPCGEREVPHPVLTHFAVLREVRHDRECASN